MPRHPVLFAPIPAAHPLADPAAWSGGTLTTVEMCKLLKVSRTELYRLMRDGLVHSVRLKGRRKFSEMQGKKYLASLARE